MKYLFRACSILILITLSCFLNIQALAKNTNEPNTKNSLLFSPKPVELSLKQAIDVAYPVAIRWNKKAMLQLCISVDGDKDIRGLDGKRTFWNINFGVPNTNKQLIIQVDKGKIELAKDITKNGPIRTKQDFIEMSEIKFDTPQLLKKAKTITKLYPGTEWAKGYNFQMTRARNSTSNIVVIIIYGWEKNHKRMKVVPFNATTGEYAPMQVGFVSP